MVEARKYHFNVGEVKSKILEFLLDNDGPTTELDLREYLQVAYNGIDQATVNRHLHDLHKLSCVELIPPSKTTTRKNRWIIAKPKNVKKIIDEYPNLIEKVQNSEPALEIVLGALMKAVSKSTKGEKYEEIEPVKTFIESIRAYLKPKLKLSTTFLKLCLTDEYALFRNLNELTEISDDESDVTFFTVNGSSSDHYIFMGTSGIDVAFKACVAMDIMERPADSRKDVSAEIEHVNAIKNKISERQLEELEIFYHTHAVKSAPDFLRQKKLVSIDNPRLQQIEKEFEAKGGKFLDCSDYLDNGPA